MLEALGNLGDFIGGIAVVATLIYLAVQIRQNSRQIEVNTAAVKAAAYQDQLEMTRVGNMEMVRDRKLLESAFLSSEELEALDPPDRLGLEVFWMGALRHHQHMFIQGQEGLIRDDLLATHDAGLRGVLGTAVVRDLWARRRDQFTPGFGEHVDRLLSG